MSCGKHALGSVYTCSNYALSVRQPRICLIFVESLWVESVGIIPFT